MLNGLYNQLYQILSSAIYDGTPTSSVYGELFCEGLSTLACAFLLILPFLAVFWLIKFLFNMR